MRLKVKVTVILEKSTISPRPLAQSQPNLVCVLVLAQEVTPHCKGQSHWGQGHSQKSSISPEHLAQSQQNLVDALGLAPIGSKVKVIGVNAAFQNF